ncbi:MAG TPA: alpha/beta hydrolase, partial [Bryobacteraceae bacterium]|nr:alpha/beta hydrolase [Bryobacteraceae bacterium]
MTWPTPRAGLLLSTASFNTIDVMDTRLVSASAAAFFLLTGGATAQKVMADIPDVETGHNRHVLDIDMPEHGAGKSLPVMFWIHGGGWQAGDKSDVALKPRALTERGFVFVSTNHRLLPGVRMEDLIADVARSVAWVHRNIAKYGGDPKRIFLGGHASG